jgi:hypothetical protein
MLPAKAAEVMAATITFEEAYRIAVRAWGRCCASLLPSGQLGTAGGRSRDRGENTAVAGRNLPMSASAVRTGSACCTAGVARHGTKKLSPICGLAGHLNTQAKLTPDEVAEIRASIASCSKLAKIYEVGSSTIWRVRTRKTWKGAGA